MKERIISKFFNGHQILFDKIDTQIYLNTTKTAKFFKTSKGNSKDVNEWLKSKVTQEYLSEMRKIVTPENFGRLIIVVNSGAVAERGTWIHKKLIVFFARWLSPKFAVWCDIQIEEILKSETKISKPEKRTDLISVSIGDMRKELEALKFILDNFNLSEKEKIIFTNKTLEKINFQTLENPHFKKLVPVFSLTDLLKEFEISETAHQFNLKLESFGIIERQENGWQIVNMNYGRNLPASFGNNPKYYKSTFQELLDL